MIVPRLKFQKNLKNLKHILKEIAYKNFEDLIEKITKLEIPNIFETIQSVRDKFEDITSEVNKYNKNSVESSIVDKFDTLFENFTLELNVLKLLIDTYFEQNGFESTNLNDINVLIDGLLDISVSNEFYEIEQIYYGQTYAQYYEKYGNYDEGVCLQNDWAYTIRNRCEKFNDSAGGVNLNGCTGKDKDGLDTPYGCAIRYNYDKQTCEPTDNYCRAFGMDHTIKYDKGKKLEFFLIMVKK